MNRKLLIFACLPLALSGCIAQSRIQAKYMAQESECRSEASRYITDNPPPPADSSVVRNENSTPVFAAFSRCMNNAGWKVSVPKGTSTASTQPPYGSPGPGGVVGSAARVSTNPQPTTAAPIIGPGVQPSPATSSTVPKPQAATTLPPSGAPGPGGVIAASPAAAPAVAPAPSPAVEAPASYQPAGRPDGAAAPNYGSGAGRNF